MLWVKLLKAIHVKIAGLDFKGCGSNGVWAKSVGSFNTLHSSGIVTKGTLKCKVGDGSSVRFWKDTWLGDGPLSTRYNRLFRLDSNEECLVNERFVNGIWSWCWNRPVDSGRTGSSLIQLKNEVSQLSSLSGTDSWQWLIGNDSTFTVSETRKHIDDITLLSLHVSTRWCKVLPRKVNIFMWRLRLDRLPHRLNLSRRGIDINSILCSVCNKGMESNEHLFCSCEVLEINAVVV